MYREALLLVAISLLALLDHGLSLQQTRPAKLSVNCSNVHEALDKCGAMTSYSHTMPTAAYPTTIEELKEACPKHNEGLHCLRQHVRCLKPMPKRAILSFIDSRRKHIKRLCSDVRSTFTRDFLDAFACIRKHKKQKFINRELRTIRGMEAIMGEQVKGFRERFQRACCSISIFRAGSIEDLGPECSQPRFIASIETAIDSVVGEAIEFACPDSKSVICTSMKDLKLSEVPSNRTLTRAGTDLMMVLTSPEADGES